MAMTGADQQRPIHTIMEEKAKALQLVPLAKATANCSHQGGLECEIPPTRQQLIIQEMEGKAMPKEALELY